MTLGPREKGLPADEVQTNKNFKMQQVRIGLGVYSQHFIFFVTYESGE